MLGTFLTVASKEWIVSWLACLLCLWYCFWLFPPIVRDPGETSFCCKDNCGYVVDSAFSFMVKKTTGTKEANNIQRFINFKLFVILMIMIMISTLVFIINSHKELSKGWIVVFGLVIIVMGHYFRKRYSDHVQLSVVGSCELFLLLPVDFNCNLGANCCSENVCEKIKERSCIIYQAGIISM